ncbi:MAG: hypothetical protein WCG27_07640 [Pseudomonadota bacterium]
MALIKQLKEMLENHFERYPHVGLNALAMRSGVGATTLRRIMNCSLKGDPAPHTVLNIVSCLYKEKRLSKLLSLVEGPIGTFLRETFGIYVETQTPHIYDTDLNQVLSDSINYFIYKLAANDAGTNRIKIFELFGKLGAEHLEHLFAMELLFEKNGVIHARDKNFILDVTVAKKHLSDLVQFFHPENLGEGRNVMHSLSESLSEEGVKKVRAIQKEAAKKILEVMNDSQYTGEIPYFTLNLGDILG